MTRPASTDHAHGENTRLAAEWLATLPQQQRPHPVIPALRERFGLSLSEAAEACREAALIHARAT